MAGESKSTTDHNEIQRWAEDRGGVPATVASTGDDDEAGILRISFPDYDNNDNDLEEISWDEFFEKFDDNDLTFLYQNETADGDESRFFKFIKQ